MQRFLSSFDRWKAARSWSVIAVGIFPLVLLVLVLGIVIWGNTVASANIVKNYIDAAEAAAPIKEDGTGANEIEAVEESQSKKPGSNKTDEAKAKEREELTNYAFKLYRRVLQQEENNKRAMYYVAYQMAQRNDLPTARSMMNKLAPDEKEGYPAAHAWRAFDLLSTAAISQKQPNRELLEHHLALAAKWGGTSAELLSQRGRMLESEGKINQALAMYSLAAERNPDYRLLLAEAFRRHEQPSRMQQAIDSTISYFSRNFNTEEETLDDRLKVARAHLLVGDVVKAVGVLEQGLATTAKIDEYKRAISQILRAAYVGSARLDAQSFSANLVLLDRAIEVDPTNPAIQQEIGRLTALLGQPKALSESIESLTRQLGAATAPTLSHLLLANLHFLNNSIEDAQLHWELALQINPNIVAALRSYALSLSLQEKPDFEKAIRLIDHAASVSDSSAEVLDAKGDILVRMDQKAEAIKCYEAALLKIQPLASLETRKKLVLLYGDLGETDKLNREVKIVEIVEKRIEEIQQSQKATLQEASNQVTRPTVVPPGVDAEQAPSNNKVDQDLESLIKELESKSSN